MRKCYKYRNICILSIMCLLLKQKEEKRKLLKRLGKTPRNLQKCARLFKCALSISVPNRLEMIGSRLQTDNRNISRKYFSWPSQAILLGESGVLAEILAIFVTWLKWKISHHNVTITQKKRKQMTEITKNHCISHLQGNMFYQWWVKIYLGSAFGSRRQPHYIYHGNASPNDY